MENLLVYQNGWLLENLASLENASKQARANKPLPKIKE